MKRKLAWLGALGSGLYLLTIGILPDPIPFIDEAMALAVLLKSTAYLGYDLRKWVPFLSSKRASKRPTPSAARRDGVTIDV